MTSDAGGTSVWTPAELEYLQTQRIGRLATLGPDGPQVRPTGFSWNAVLGTLDIGGMNMTSSRKWKNIMTDPRVSFVVDDLASVHPWRPRGVELRGDAETVEADGGIIRITPRKVLAWGIESDPFATPVTRTIS